MNQATRSGLIAFGAVGLIGGGLLIVLLTAGGGGRKDSGTTGAKEQAKSKDVELPRAKRPETAKKVVSPMPPVFPIEVEKKIEPPAVVKGTVKEESPKMVKIPVKNIGTEVGIDREKILKIMTSRSSEVIFFNDQGEVLSVHSPQVYDSFFEDGPAFALLLATRQLHPELRNMGGKIRITFTRQVLGKRFAQEEAERILDDCIRLQNGKPARDALDDLEKSGGFKIPK